MPERPDLAWVIPKLREAVVGRTILGVQIGDPVVLRVGVRGELDALLIGHRIAGVRRHLHFVVFDLEPPPDGQALGMAVHPMLAGRFRLEAPKKRRTKDTCVSWTLDDEIELRYRDDKRMGKVYLMPRDRLETVPGFMPEGVDVLDADAFTPEVLAKLLRKRRDQIKLFVMDKRAVDAFGNAYADECLHRAGLHPKRRCSELDADEVGRLHTAMVSTLAEATAEVARRAPAIDEKIRDFLAVRNRKGEACPVCGDTIRTVGVRGHDAFLCPTCQPDPKQRGFVRWSDR